MISLRRTAGSQAGYTLAEMLVAAATIGLIMAGLLTILMTGQKSFTIGTNRSEAQQSARLILHRLAEEVRVAGYDPRNTASFAAITALTPPQTGFTISNDWNATGAIETNLSVTVNGALRGEQITYDFANSALRRQESQINGSPVDVSSAITAISFQYLDADDVAVNTPHLASSAATIRTVVVTVTTTQDLQSSQSTGDAVSVKSTIRARVRNRS
jgi:type II secretory pathway pseudopilin PulG